MKTEAALSLERHRSKRYLDLIDLAQDAIIVRDLDHRALTWNKGAERLFGWAADEAIGKRVQDLIHTVFPVPFEEFHATLLKEGHWEGTVECSARDGTPLILEHRFTLKRDKTGTLARILSISYDVTAQRQAEDALRQAHEEVQMLNEELQSTNEELQSSNEELRVANAEITSTNEELRNEVAERTRIAAVVQQQLNLIDLAYDAVIVRDLDHHALTWNKGAEHLFGWTKKEALGKRVPDLTRSVYPMPFEKFHATLLAQGHWEGTVQCATRDSTPLIVEHRFTVERDAAGEPVRLLSISADVTAQKSAEAERESIAKFPEENPNPILRLSPAGAILYANAASDVLLHDPDGGTAPFDRVRGCAAHAYMSGTASALEVTVATNVFQLALIPLRDEGYVNVYGLDITARKRAEESLQQSHEEVQSLNEELQSTNEELRMANEELAYRVQERTEELASMNEELRVSNEELRHETAERTRAEKDARGHAQRAAILNDIVRVLNEAEDLPTLYDRALTTTIDQLEFKSGLIATKADTGYLEVQYAYNLPAAFTDAVSHIHVDASPYLHAIYRKGELIVRDEQPPDSDGYRLGLRGAAVSIPFVSEGIVSGHIALHAADRRVFASDERELFKAIGLEFGMAVARLTAKQQAEQRATMLDGAHDAIVMWDINDHITYWNRGAERLYGWSRDEAIGKDVHDLLSTTFPEPLKRIKATLNEGGRWEGELSHTTRYGKSVFVESHMTLQRALDETPIATLEINTDVTGRKRAEEHLRATSFYTRGLIEASLDPLVTISAEGKVTDVDHAAEEVTGYSRDELIGSDFSDYFTEPDKAQAGYKQVFAEGIVKDYPLTIKHSSGSMTDVLYNATVYRNEAGEVQGVFAAARDITDRKRAEEHVKEHARRAEIVSDVIAVGNQAPDLTSALTAMLDLVVERLQLDSGGIFLRDTPDLVSLQYARGYTAEQYEWAQRIPLTQPRVARAMAGEAIISDDYQAEISPDVKQMNKAVASMATIPLVARDEVVGFYNVATSGRPHRFTQEEADLLTTLGREAGTVIARMQAEERVQQVRTAPRRPRRRAYRPAQGR